MSERNPAFDPSAVHVEEYLIGPNGEVVRLDTTVPLADFLSGHVCVAESESRDLCQQIANELPHIACPCGRAPGKAKSPAQPSEED